MGGALGYAYSGNQEEVYEANASLLVQQRRSVSIPGVSDFDLSSQLDTTYARLVRTSPFLSRVQQENELPVSVSQLKEMIDASTGSRPPTLNIRVRSHDPALAGCRRIGSDRANG